MKAYIWRQNNSGGHFQNKDGIGPTVIIFANDEVEAEGHASTIGIYYDGVGQGFDCECCGDRWHPSDEADIDSFLYPMMHSEYSSPMVVHYKNYKGEWEYARWKLEERG